MSNWNIGESIAEVGVGHGPTVKVVETTYRGYKIVHHEDFVTIPTISSAMKFNTAWSAMVYIDELLSP